MAKISVVIPVLNSKKYIKECMDSIVGQKLKDIEIIPVDAGSTDGTLEILEAYAAQDNRIKLLHSPIKSMGHQYNLGIAVAKGEYIGFCESDDYITATMYEKLYQIARENKLDYVRSDFDMFIDKSERLFLNYHILAGDRAQLYEKVIRPFEYPNIMYRDVNMWNGIYKRKFLQKNQIRLNETPGAAFQDTGFVIQTFLLAERAMYVHERTNNYRRDNINSSVYNLNGIINVVWEAEFSQKYLSKYNVTNEHVHAVIFHRFCSLFFGFYGKLPEKDKFTDEVRDAIKKFAEMAKKIYDFISYREIAFEEIELSLSLYLLLKDLEEFDALRRQIETTERSSRYKFFMNISRYQKAVIFGAGEVGTSLYAFLHKNDYEGVICFSDNDSNKWGKYIMGKEIVSPTRLSELDDGATVFLIAMISHTEIIREQLISMNIDENNIYKAIVVIPHNAMEIDVKSMITED